MERNDDNRESELIDLGAIETETKGRGDVPVDIQGGLRLQAGLADD